MLLLLSLLVGWPRLCELGRLLLLFLLLLLPLLLFLISLLL